MSNLARRCRWIAPAVRPEAIERASPHATSPPRGPVPDDLLEEILHLATLAPSGYNLQPWRFLVVKSAANREKLRHCQPSARPRSARRRSW